MLLLILLFAHLVLQRHYVYLEEGTTEQVVQLCREMDVVKLFKEYEAKEMKRFKAMLEEAPEGQLPKATWNALYEFTAKQWLTFFSRLDKK